MMQPRSSFAFNFNLRAYIWARTMASQMSPAVTRRVVVDVRGSDSDLDAELELSLDTLRLRANGSQQLFPGFLVAYTHGGSKVGPG